MGVLRLDLRPPPLLHPRRDFIERFEGWIWEHHHHSCSTGEVS